ncbi:sugar phosphate isomerase/epimerase [Sphingobium sp.]|uniref:sugar phosphate isomerase/epimerase family protein n=1 Tax=Sphingobium sp. TaxID=1912891 RepID=UPI0026273565|nr:sugar phosphate isomerase/epimerase [Sphingobium sp.]
MASPHRGSRKPAAPSLGVQLFMAEEQARRDLDATLDSIAQIGFTTVEVAGFCGQTPAALGQAIRRAGLVCTSVHMQGRDRGDDAPHLDRPVQALIEDAHDLGAARIVLASFLFPDDAPTRAPNERLAAYVARIGNVMDANAWRRNADRLNRLGAQLARADIHIGYHNHNAEFAPLADGGTGMDILLRETDPALVEFEMDAGWVAAAGKDPITLLRSHPGRFRQMHVKNVARAMQSNFAFRQTSAPLDNGAIDWRALLDAARTNSVCNLYIEQDPPYSEDPLHILRRNHDYLAPLMARSASDAS